MKANNNLKYFFQRNRMLSFSLIVLLFLTISGTRNAQALTMLLDFSTTSTDMFNETTGAFNATPFGFSGLNATEVQQATLDAVMDHFLGYPSNFTDANSFLPAGMELDINFEIGSVANAPTNGDTEYYFMKIGDGLAGANATNQNILGAACLGCVSDSNGVAHKFNRAVVGSIWTDHIDSIAGLAASDQELINLITGTISHEIGHTLSLIHTGAQAPNPGASSGGVMGSGATSMPSNHRILEREFTYDNFNQLIDAVGLRQASTVPEPSTMMLFGLGILFFAFKKQRQTV